MTPHESSLHLRAARIDERDVLWALRTRCVRETCRSHYPDSVIAPWSAAPPPQDFLRLLAEGACLLAEDRPNGAVAGYGAIDVQQTLIQALFVAPEYAGRGLGLQLLRAMEQRVPAGTELRLSASLNAEAFYRRAGYEAIRREIYPHPAGMALDSVLMRRRV